MHKLSWLLPLFMLFALVVSCDESAPPTLPPPSPGGGFIIGTLSSFNGGPPFNEGLVEIDSDWVSDVAGAAGDPTSFTAITDAQGLAAADGKRAPAQWKFTWVASNDASDECDGQSITLSVPLNGVAEIECNVSAGGIFAAGNSSTCRIPSI